MKNKITIGKSSIGKQVTIDVQSMLIQKILLAAATGSGKSWLLRLLSERLNGIVQTVLIDWDGDFVSLQSKFDFLIIGNGRDISPQPSHVYELGKMIHSLGVSVVLDTSEYDFDSGERQRFAADFLRGIYDAADESRKTKRAHYVQIIVDEAHNFAPEEKISFDNPAYKSRSILRRINSQGRSRWLGLVLATQRLAKLDKSSIDGLKNQILGYFVLENDKKTAAAQLGLGKSEFAQIKDLEDGEFLAYGRMFGHKEIFRFKTDEVKTYHPTPGKIKVQASTKPSDSIRAIVKKLADLPQIVDEKISNENQLRIRIKELEQQLRQAKFAIQVKPVIQEKPVIEYKPIEVPVLKNGQMEKLGAVVERMSKVVTVITKEMAKVSNFKMPVVQQVASRVFEQKPKIKFSNATAVHRFDKSMIKPARETAGDLPRGEKAILTACIQFPDGLRREQLTVLTGYKRSSRDAYIYRLTERGYVVTNGNSVTATNEGKTALPTITPLPVGIDLQQYWMNNLPEGEKRILAFLIERYPNEMQRDEIDAITGYKRSSRDAFLSRLSAKQLVVEPVRGSVKASDDLF